MSLLVVWISCIVKCLVHIICVQISLCFFLSLTMYLWLSAWCTWCGMYVLRHTCGGQGTTPWSQLSPSGFIWSLGVELKPSGLCRCVCFLRRLTHPGRNFVCNRFNCAFIFYHWLAFYFSSQLSLSSLNLSANMYSWIYNTRHCDSEEDISHGKLFFPAWVALCGQDWHRLKGLL